MSPEFNWASAIVETIADKIRDGLNEQKPKIISLAIICVKNIAIEPSIVLRDLFPNPKGQGIRPNLPSEENKTIIKIKNYK